MSPRAKEIAFWFGFALAVLASPLCDLLRAGLFVLALIYLRLV
jgi:hypothetical protein